MFIRYLIIIFVNRYHYFLGDLFFLFFLFLGNELLFNCLYPHINPTITAVPNIAIYKYPPILLKFLIEIPNIPISSSCYPSVSFYAYLYYFLTCISSSNYFINFTSCFWVGDN